jgi:hypothetical protein
MTCRNAWADKPAPPSGIRGTRRPGLQCARDPRAGPPLNAAHARRAATSARAAASAGTRPAPRLEVVYRASSASRDLQGRHVGPHPPNAAEPSRSRVMRNVRTSSSATPHPLEEHFFHHIFSEADFRLERLRARKSSCGQPGDLQNTELTDERSSERRRRRGHLPRQRGMASPSIAFEQSTTRPFTRTSR